MIKAIIFDMDGVLFDTEMIYINKRIRFFSEFDPSISEELIRKNAGGNGTKFIREVYKDLPSSEVEAIVKQYRSIPTPKENFVETMFEGVPETLDYLYRHGCKLGLGSSSSLEKIHKALETVGISQYFTCVLSAETYNAIKPSPVVYQKAIEKLDISSDEALVVEDSTFGIQAAKNAGIRVICKKDDRFGYDQSGCDYYIDSIREIIPIWEKES